MKKLFAILLPMVIVTSALAGCFATAGSGSLGYVSVNINPSVQFVTNAKDEVVEVVAGNEEGEIILLDQLDNLVGLKVDAAVQKIVELAITHGYLDPNALLGSPGAVSIATILESRRLVSEDALRARIKTRLDNYFNNNGIFAVVLTDLDMQSVLTEAQELNIAPARLRLINGIINVYGETYTKEQLLEMTMEQLIDLMKNARQHMVNDAQRAAYIAGLQAQAQQRRQVAESAYNTWQLNKATRAQNFANELRNLAGNLTQSERQALIESFVNSWQGDITAD